MKKIGFIFLIFYSLNVSMFSQVELEIELMEQISDDFRNGEYLKVIRNIRTLLKVYPMNEVLLEYKGYSNMYLGNIDEAITDFESIVEINPYSKQNWAILGVVYFRKENYEKAIYNSLKSYNINKNSFAATLILSTSYLRTGNYTLASEFYERTLELIQNKSQFEIIQDVLSKEIKNGVYEQEARNIYKNLENHFNLYYENNLNKSVKIVPQARHTAGINSINLSTSQEVYITGSDDYSIKVYDANSHLLKRTISEGINSGISKAIISPNEKLIAGIERATGGDPTIKIWDAYNGELVLKLSGFAERCPGDIEFANEGGHIASCSGDSIKIWNLELPNTPVSFSIKNAGFSQIEYYDQGSKMISAGSDSIIRIWDLETKKVFKEHKFSEGQVRSMLLINNEKLLVSVLQNEQTNNSYLNIWNLSNFTLVHQETLGNIILPYFPLCEYKNTLLYGQGDTLVVLDLINFNILNKKGFSNETVFFYGDITAINAWGGDIVVAIGNPIELDDFAILNEQFVKTNTIGVNNRKNYGAQISLSENGKNLFLDGWSKDSTILLLDAFTLEEINNNIFNSNTPKFYHIVDSIKKKPSFNEIQFNNDNTLLGLIDDNFEVFVFDLNNGNRIFEGSFLYDKFEKINISFTDDNRLVSFATAYELIVYDLVNDKILINKIFEKGTDELIMYRDGRMIASVHSREQDGRAELMIWDLEKNGDQLMDFEIPLVGSNLLCFSQNGEKIAWAGGDILSRNHFPIIVWDLIKKEQVFTLEGHQSFTKNMFFCNNDKVLISCGNNGQIKFWDLTTHVEIGTLVVEDDKDYIFYTPSNFYLSKIENSFNSMAFLVDEKVYPFEQFDLVFNRPDYVLDKIGGSTINLLEAYSSAFRKRLAKMDLDFNELNINKEMPVVEVINDSKTRIFKDSFVHLTLKAMSKISNLHQINIWINDVPIYGRNGLKLSEQGTQKWTQNLTVTLSPGENKIQASALNQNGIESLKETIYINYEAPLEKPNLHVILIGANKFKNSDYDLVYPLKDLRDLSDLFQSDTAIYENVYVDSLFNEDVTLANIKKLKKGLLKTKVDDRIILFVSGHGIIDEEFDFYFANSLMDFENPAKYGISYDVLENLLDSIPARQKLFIMDACHSGEIDKDNVELIKRTTKEREKVRFRSFNSGPQSKRVGIENSFELMKQLFVDLRRGTGATVISSAGGVEFAWEGDQWNNSVFAYSFLSGLKEYNADANDDNVITLSELRDYLHVEVPRLTDNHQRPTMRVENISNDWRIW